MQPCGDVQTGLRCSQPNSYLILRSAPEGRVSKDGRALRAPALSFETRAISAFTRVFDALWRAPQDEGSSPSHRIQPAEMQRVALASEQRHGLVQRQADHIGVGADQLDHEGPGEPLDRIAAGLAAPFA